MSFASRAQRAYEALCFREGMRLTYDDLAARFAQAGGAAVTGVTVGRWLRGEREPTLTEIERLARVLGVPAGQLAFDTVVLADAPAARAPVVNPTPARVPPPAARRGRKGRSG